MKKLVTLILACLMTLSAFSFVGCGNRRGEVDVDETKTQIYVSSFDGGIGSKWIEEVGEVFAEKVKDYSFQEGRKGVQIIIKDTTDSGDYLQARMLSQDQDIYFTEEVVYNNYVNAGIVYDITDVMEQGAITGVDANGNFTRESSPVKNKVDESFLNFLYTTKSSSSQKGYYAIPFYYAARGLIFDADLWNEKSFYLGKGGCPSETVIEELAKGANANLESAKESYNTKITGDLDETYLFVDKTGYSAVLELNIGLSAGPDGKYGTADDGMPATIEEFYALMTKMSTSDTTPMIWPGASPNYAENLTNAFWQNDAGVEELKLFYTLTGSTDSLVKIENGSIVMENGVPKLESATFNGGADNGYDLSRSVYKLNALNFVNKICTTSDWTHDACYDGTTNIQAQTHFLTEGITKQNTKRIAMLLDGCWWQTEATRTFDAVVKEKGEQYSKENRDYGFFYLPNSSIDRLIQRVNNNEGYTIVPSTSSFIFINQRLANEGMTERLEAAKAFVSYLQSDEALYLFAQKTSMCRSVFAEFSDEQINALPKYCRNVIEYIGNANIVYPYTSNELVNKNSSQFKNAADGWLWRTNITGVGEKYFPIQTMHDNNSVTPESYFCGMYNYYKNSMWTYLQK